MIVIVAFLLLLVAINYSLVRVVQELREINHAIQNQRPSDLV